MRLPLSPCLFLIIFSWTTRLARSVSHSATRSTNGQFKVICRLTNWAFYRRGIGQYLVSNIDTDLCTHIVYDFAALDGNTLIMKTADSWVDIDNGFYEDVTALKSNGVKVVIGIGGWEDSTGDKYSRLVNNAQSRKLFIDKAIEFIEEYNFDGLELSWEYPACPQTACNPRYASDKAAYTAWVKELKEAFQPRGLLLSASVATFIHIINQAYEVKEISKHFDWITVMAYDYHGHWDKQTGHVAPLYGDMKNEGSENAFDSYNVDASIKFWLENGAPKDVIVMGMPMYGQSFQLKDVNQNSLGAPAYGGGGSPGRFTYSRGFLAYYEICHSILTRNWNVVRDQQKRMGPYAFAGYNWVGFDDAETIKQKSEYVKSMGLAGASIWSLDLDDFNNYCGCETYPLLKTINRVLRNYPNPGKICNI